MAISNSQLEKCASLLGGEFVIHGTELMFATIAFGQRELYTLVLGAGVHGSVIFRHESAGGIADIEIAFYCDHVEFIANPYGGASEAIQFYDSKLHRASLTLIPLAADRRCIWLSLPP